ncbi:hypothetical protein DRQ53_04090 [bacterium]|nr:MAG: hypothetical protein DRQ53_04090 [bacterium]
MEATQAVPADAIGSVFELLLFLTTSLVFSISAYVIGRKLGHSSPWMAWIPFLNLVYFVDLAQAPRYVVIMFFVPLVNLWATVTTFASIADRLNMPRWLGFCMIVPVLNMFTIAYLAGSGQSEAKAAPFIVRRSERARAGSRA